MVLTSKWTPQPKLAPGPNGLPRECRVCKCLHTPKQPLGLFEVIHSRGEVNPPDFAFAMGTHVLRHGRLCCEQCFLSSIVANFDAEELAFHREYLRKRDAEDRKRGAGKRKVLVGVFLGDIEGNTPEWMRARFGPDLKRGGASKACTILNVDAYGCARAFYYKLTPERQQLALDMMLAHGIPIEKAWMYDVKLLAFEQCGYPYVPERSEGSEKKNETEFGHAYEDFDVALAHLLMPQLEIRPGGICVPSEERWRKWFAVSADGLVYDRQQADPADPCKGFVGVFEAKCSWNMHHAEQVLSKLVCRSQPPRPAELKEVEQYLLKNPNAPDGVKREHMAQMQHQMAVIGAPYAYYITVKWCRWIPPHPELGIPPFEVDWKGVPKVHLVRVHRSAEYWNWAWPQMQEFALAVRGKSDPPAPLGDRCIHPPRVQVDNLLAPDTAASKRLLQLQQTLRKWELAHPFANIIGDAILTLREEQKHKGESVDFSVWW